MQGNVGLANNADTPAMTIDHRNAPYLVPLHQRFA
jgi:hypothetical protein